MARIPDPVSQLDTLGRQIYDQLIAKRGRIDGMYRTMLNYPELTQHVSQLGTFLRFESLLPGNIRELAILTAAYHFKAAYEWVKHVPPAKEAGLSDSVIEKIRKGLPLDDISHIFAGVQKCVILTLQHQSIPEDLQQLLQQEFGIKGVIELVVLAGFYSMIAGLIFAFDVPLPPGEAFPFYTETH